MNPDLQTLRGMDLVRVMEHLGYAPAQHYGGTFEYRLTDGRKLAVTPEPRNARRGGLGMFQVWNGESFAGRTGGAGAVDLVMTVTGKPLRAALGWLAEAFSQVPRVETARPKVHEHDLPLLQRRFSLPEKHPDAGVKVRAYLCQSRCLPPSLVVPLLDAGTIYPHVHSYTINGKRRSFTNAVFVMRHDATLEPAGSMVRGCYDGRRPRKSTLPLENGNAAAFWIGEPLAQATRVVVTESPIECVSFVALQAKRAGLHCRTYGGNRWRYVAEIFDQLKRSTGELICGFNNDEAGNDAAQELAQLCHAGGIRYQRLKPETKDWNDDLRARSETLELL